MNNAELFHATFAPFVGEKLTIAESKAIMAAQTSINPGSNLPTDHAYNDAGNIYCNICKQHGALFARSGRTLTVQASGSSSSRSRGAASKVNVDAVMARLTAALDARKPATETPAEPVQGEPATDAQ